MVYLRSISTSTKDPNAKIHQICSPFLTRCCYNCFEQDFVCSESVKLHGCIEPIMKSSRLMTPIPHDLIYQRKSGDGRKVSFESNGNSDGGAGHVTLVDQRAAQSPASVVDQLNIKACQELHYISSAGNSDLISSKDIGMARLPAFTSLAIWSATAHVWSRRSTPRWPSRRKRSTELVA